MQNISEVASSAQIPSRPRWSWRSNLGFDLLLVSVAAIWGSTFLVVKDTLTLVGPFSFLGLRFTIGAITLALIFRKRLARISRAEIKYGLLIGIFLFAMYAFQTVGLQFTAASKAAFITGLYVPLVPLLLLFLLRQRPTVGATIGVVLSVVGLFLVSLNDDFNLEIGWGEILVVACAIAAALHIVLISKFAPQLDPINLTIVQIAVTAGLSWLLVPCVGEVLTAPTWSVWGVVLFMGVVSTAFPLTMMNRVPQYMSSTRATLIYALEPVFAALFGLFAGDVLSVPAWIGCAFIFGGMICSELKFGKRRKKDQPLAQLASSASPTI
jgi:drug/metabolite transporter (DMT)-like permease